MTTPTADEYDNGFRTRKAPRSLISRGSRCVVQKVEDPDTGEWREIIRMTRVKFDDAAKAVFLEEYRKWGRMGESSAAAGVSPQCVREHMEKDDDFAKAVLVCEEEYKDKLIGHHQDLVFNGTVKQTFDRNGNLVSEETIYPIRLIELELKKHDSGYREKQEMNVNHSGGVLVAPAEMESIDDWQKRFQKDKMIDVTPKEVD
jgi:hypothetical protein